MKGGGRGVMERRSATQALLEKEMKNDENWCADSAGAQPLIHPRGALLCVDEQPSSMATLCPVRRRLFSALLRQPRRSFTSATDSSEKRLLSQDDWTAFQLDRAERTTLG